MATAIKQFFIKIPFFLIGLMLLAGCKKINTELSDKSSELLTEKAPRIVFAETLHDFGRLISGNDLEHTFTFTNVGNATLVIEDIKAG